MGLLAGSAEVYQVQFPIRPEREYTQGTNVGSSRVTFGTRGGLAEVYIK
jgi:hypothetical protein